MIKQKEPWDVPPTLPPPEAYVFELDVSDDYRRQYEEDLAKWKQYEEDLVERRRGRPVKVRARIKFLQDCQTMLRAGDGKLGRRLRHKYDMYDCVYLIWCPTKRRYKIGHTKALHTRLRTHRRELDHEAEFRIAYYTPLNSKLLEYLLHRHFDFYHRPSHSSVELFALPQKEADEFAATAKAIEEHLFAVEILRLKALLLRFESECQ